MFRHIALPLLLVALLATPCRADAASNPKDSPKRSVTQRIGIAAVVNDDVITFADLVNRTKLYISGNRQQPSPEMIDKISGQILNKLIDEKLQLQAAKSLGISVPDDMVLNAFNGIAQQNNLPADEFRKRLLGSGVKVETLYDQIRAEIAWDQVVRRKIRPQVNVTESEIDTAMTQMKNKAGTPEFQVAEIFLPVKSDAEDGDVRSQANKIIDKLTKGGASFAQIARETSQSPGAAAGGDIGWIPQGQLDKVLDDALTSMQAGQMSPPLRSEKGYHILLLRNVRQHAAVSAAAETAVEDEAKPAQQTTPKSVSLKQILIPVLESDPAPVVSAKTVRAEQLATEVSSCDDMAAHMKDFPGDGTKDYGMVDLASLPPTIAGAVATLDTGKLTRPLRVEDGIVVLMVCGKEGVAEAPAEASAEPAAPGTSPAAATPDDENSRDAVANKIGVQRMTQMQLRYLRDLRATAFIDKRL